MVRDRLPEEGLTADTIAKSIATFERTVVSGYAPFDAWVDGDEKAISESAKRGFVLFNGKARCADCHTGWNFTDNKFHDIGVADQGSRPRQARARRSEGQARLQDAWPARHHAARAVHA